MSVAIFVVYEYMYKHMYRSVHACMGPMVHACFADHIYTVTCMHVLLISQSDPIFMQGHYNFHYKRPMQAIVY